MQLLLELINMLRNEHYSHEVLKAMFLREFHINKIKYIYKDC